MEAKAEISPLVARLCALNKQAQLKSLARLCGTQSSGTKPVLASNLLATSQMRLACQPTRILSIDMGIKNIGACLLRHRDNEKPQIEQCFRTFLPDYDILDWHVPVTFVTKVEKFMDGLLSQTQPDCVLIERQRTNSGKQRVPNIILRLIRLETAIHMALKTKAPSIYVESPLPRMVVDFWNDPTAKRKPKERGYRNAKLVRSELVKQWLERNELDRPFEISGSLAKRMELEGKRDDMSDALAQGMAWIFWRETGADLQELLLKEDPATSFSPLFDSCQNRLTGLTQTHVP